MYQVLYFIGACQGEKKGGMRSSLFEELNEAGR